MIAEVETPVQDEASSEYSNLFPVYKEKGESVSKVISINAYWKLYLKHLLSTYWKQVENSWKKIYRPAKKNNYSFVSVQHSRLWGQNWDTSSLAS